MPDKDEKKKQDEEEPEEELDEDEDEEELKEEKSKREKRPKIKRAAYFFSWQLSKEQKKKAEQEKREKERREKRKNLRALSRFMLLFYVIWPIYSYFVFFHWLTPLSEKSLFWAILMAVSALPGTLQMIIYRTIFLMFF